MVKKSGYDEGESWQTGSSIKRANMELLVEWLLTPREVREPKTKTALAEQLGVTTQTLRNYEKDLFVVKELQRRRRDVFKVEHVGDIVATLVVRATDPDAGASGNQAAKILLDWGDKQTQDMNAAALRDLSDAELKGMLADMYERLDQ